MREQRCRKLSGFVGTRKRNWQDDLERRNPSFDRVRSEQLVTPTSVQCSAITLMARMNAANDALEAFYLTTRLNNARKIHIVENSEWLKSGVRLVDLRCFYEVLIAREWDSRSWGVVAGGPILAAVGYCSCTSRCAIVKRVHCYPPRPSRVRHTCNPLPVPSGCVSDPPDPA